MKQFDIKISIEPNGRLISEMIKLFNKYDSNILIRKNTFERQVDGKSMLGVLSIAPHIMDTLHITIIGNYELNDSIDLQDQLKFLLLEY